MACRNSCGATPGTTGGGRRASAGVSSRRRTEHPAGDAAGLAARHEPFPIRPDHPLRRGGEIGHPHPAIRPGPRRSSPSFVVRASSAWRTCSAGSSCRYCSRRGASASKVRNTGPRIAASVRWKAGRVFGSPPGTSAPPATAPRGAAPSPPRSIQPRRGLADAGTRSEENRFTATDPSRLTSGQMFVARAMATRSRRGRRKTTDCLTRPLPHRGPGPGAVIRPGSPRSRCRSVPPPPRSPDR